VLHVRDAAAWAANTAWRPVAGDSLVFDYIYFMHPVRTPKKENVYTHSDWHALASEGSWLCLHRSTESRGGARG